MRLLLLSIFALISSISFALDEDRELPIDIRFDFMELDIETGQLLYTGNVELVQGNLIIQAEELLVNVRDGVLQNAEAKGSPASVKDLLSDNADPHLLIKGNLIEYDAANLQIIVTEDAFVEKGVNRLSAYQVFYDIAQGKVRAKRGGEQERVQMRFNSIEQ